MPVNRFPFHLSILALLLVSTGCVSERVVYVDRPRREPSPRPTPAPQPEVVREDEDPPTRVARLNYLSGAVSFRPAGLEEWGRARLNFPLKGGDALWTDDDGRAELHVGAAALRLARDTSLSLLRLDDQLLQLRLSRGTAELRIPSLDDRETVEFATPAGAVILERIGSYRVDVDPDRERVVVTVRRGTAEVSAAGQNVAVHAGESLVLVGGERPSYDIMDAIARNEFEDWCAARDRREDRAESAARYVGRDMIGYEDLDENGTWRSDVTYGNVWVPRVSVGWAPYRHGHWAWVEPWGWTWIDDAPWGFAPFHYGRWALIGGGWAWIPRGPGITVRARPVYAPALVAFVGGNHFSASISAGGGVAWFPLGPREPYVPGYRCSPTYVRNVNVVHVTNVTHITNITYVNRGMATAVPNEVFRGGRPVHGAVVPVNAQALAGGQVMGGAALAPRRDSLLPRPLTPGRVAAPPVTDLSRSVVARTAPPPAPVSFDARQRLLEANPGRPLDRQTLDGLRRQSPAPAAPPVRTVVPSANIQTLQPARPELRAPRPLAPTPLGRPTPETPRPRAAEPAGPRTERREDPRLDRRPVPQPEPRRVEEPRRPEPTRRLEEPRRVEEPPPRRIEEPRRAEPLRRLEEPRRVEEPRPRKDPEKPKEKEAEKEKPKPKVVPRERGTRPEERDRK